MNNYYSGNAVYQNGAVSYKETLIKESVTKDICSSHLFGIIEKTQERRGDTDAGKANTNGRGIYGTEKTTRLEETVGFTIAMSIVVLYLRRIQLTLCAFLRCFVLFFGVRLKIAFVQQTCIITEDIGERSGI